MYVPDLVHRANEGGFLRLLSVAKATQSGCQFIFDAATGDYIVLPGSGARIPLVRKDGLIWLHSLDTAIGGYRWALGCICFRSGYHLAELLKSKSDAPSVWRRMLLRIQSLECRQAY